MTPDTSRSPIAPCLWFDNEAESAADFYTDVFPDSRVTAIARYPESFDNPGGKPRGSVMTVELDLAGTTFTALNGGPQFTINPTISFFVRTDDVATADHIATTLGDGGSYLMELGEYPWSPRYAWVQDRFGVSWQVMAAPEARKPIAIFPCLMFAGEAHGHAEEALRHYAGMFPGGSVEALERYTEEDGGSRDSVKHGRISLEGHPLVAMDSHLEHDARFNEAVSLQIYCRDQDEIDHFWSALCEGGDEGPCGWLHDRFGVSWQVVPTSFVEMIEAGDGGGVGYERAFEAMLEMKKLDIAALEAAYREGENR